MSSFIELALALSAGLQAVASLALGKVVKDSTKTARSQRVLKRARSQSGSTASVPRKRAPKPIPSIVAREIATMEEAGFTSAPPMTSPDEPPLPEILSSRPQSGA